MESGSEPSINSTQAERIKRLFVLQAQCGVWGVILGGAWVAGVNSNYDSVYSHHWGPVIFWITGLLFLATSVIAAGYFLSKQIKIASANFLLHTCSVLCIIAICILIWATGGVHSPFTPFYVMTYTLTLERISEGTNKWRIFFVFVLPIAVICILERIQPLIEITKLNDIMADTFYTVAVLVGIVLSILVPTLSAWLEAKFVDGTNSRAK